MKKIIILFLAMASLESNAQNSISNQNNVIISSNIDLDEILDLHRKKNEQTDVIKGYRIQIIANNDRAKIYSLRSDVYTKFPNIKNYLKYEQPYYRLRIGDFQTRLEAHNLLKRVIKHFPSAFIVADEVKIR